MKLQDQHKTMHQVSNECHTPMHGYTNTLYDPQPNTCLSPKVKDSMNLIVTLLSSGIFSLNFSTMNLTQIQNTLNVSQFLGENLDALNESCMPRF